MHTYRAKITRVIDADTMDAVIDVGFRMTTHQRLRLLGVQAPEMSTVAGRAAKEWVEDFLAAHENHVTIMTHKTGSFGRWLAVILVPEQNLNDLLLERGIAVPYKR
jgi:endonuclease YncB( thermonuclease family)